MAIELSIEPADASADRHVELLHDWMNRPHVALWWQLDRPPEEIRDYLSGLTHLRPWIVSADGTPFGYVETYAVPDDPLAAHYPARETDVGWHLLVGPEEFLGSGIPRLLGHAFIALQLGRAIANPATGPAATPTNPIDHPGRLDHPGVRLATRRADQQPHRGDRLVCEPDVRNTRMHAFCRRLGFEPIGEVDLPDKRALLMACTPAQAAVARAAHPDGAR